MFLRGVDYSSTSDSDLDQAYADAYARYASSTGQDKLQASIDMNDAGQEILTREATVGGFLVALMGSRFPKYDAIQKQTGGFVAHDQAITSVEESASHVATNLEEGAKQVFSAGKWLGLGALAIAALVLWKKIK